MGTVAGCPGTISEGVTMVVGGSWADAGPAVATATPVATRMALMAYVRVRRLFMADPSFVGGFEAAS